MFYFDIIGTRPIKVNMVIVIKPSITTTQASVLLTPTFTKRQTGQSSKYAITAATNTGIISPPHNSNTAVVKRIKISNIAASGSENLRRYQRPKTLII